MCVGACRQCLVRRKLGRPQSIMSRCYVLNSQNLCINQERIGGSKGNSSSGLWQKVLPMKNDAGDPEEVFTCRSPVKASCALGAAAGTSA